MKKKLENKTSLTTLIMIALAIVLFMVNMVMLWTSTQINKTIIMLRSQLELNLKDQAIISSSESIAKQYIKEIEIISKVFPQEETMPEFIRMLEDAIQEISTEYSIKFNSTQPIVEGNKLFLPITVILKTVPDSNISFLEKLEQLPYMTHVTLLSITAPDGLSGNMETRVSFKIYVKTPFVSQ